MKPELLTNVEEDDDELQPTDDDIVEDECEAFPGYEPNYCFITRPLFLTPKTIKEDWRRRSIFSTMCHIHQKPGILIIDPAASENITAKKVVDFMKFMMLLCSSKSV